MNTEQLKKELLLFAKWQDNNITSDNNEETVSDYLKSLPVKEEAPTKEEKFTKKEIWDMLQNCQWRKDTQITEKTVERLGITHKQTLPTGISDEDIAKWVKEHGYYGHCTQEYHEGLEEGAKDMRDKFIKHLNE